MFQNIIHTRIRFVFLVIIFLFILVILKVFYIQIFQYDKLAKLAKDLWSRNLPIAADRGIITDRKGRELATNITTTSLVLIPNQIVNKDEVSTALAEILDVTKEEMDTHVNKRTSIERVHPEGRKLSYDIAKKIDNLKYDGVYLVKESKRYYPFNNTLSHVLGYVGIDNQGLSGLELYYDNYLTGEDGAIKYFSDGKGNKLELTEIYQKPQNGVNISLTIDLDIQLSMEREIDNVISKYNPEHALAIAMNPKTGEILGMTARPNFDSNNYQNYSTEVINRNLPIWMTYEPGSTFKIVTLAASIEEQEVNLFEDRFFDGGSVSVGGARLKCWKAGGHGDQSYLNVVENSCNPGFVSLGLRLGKEKLFSYIDDLGFGRKTNIDLNGEGAGILFKLDRVKELELATTAFGQGISVTPIQQVNAVSAIINGGTLYKPYIAKTFIEPETKSVVKTMKPQKEKEIISKETSGLVRYALESVVANGTGRNAYIENYRVGGKTGTAQKVKDGRYMVGNYIVSFIGFAPADDPQIVVYVAIDNPKGVTQYGGTVAAPVAKSIINDAINILEIDKGKNAMPKEYQWLDIKYINLPDVEGLNVEDARTQLKGFQIEYAGEGEKIIHQSPEGNNLVAENSKIKLMLGS